MTAHQAWFILYHNFVCGQIIKFEKYLKSKVQREHFFNQEGPATTSGTSSLTYSES